MNEILFTIICTNVTLNARLFNLLQNNNLKIGYIGTCQEKLPKFIKSKNKAIHIIFHQPDYINLKMLNPTELKILGQVHIILICANFQPVFAPLFQNANFAGVITSAETDQIEPKLICDFILELGYYPNRHIPKRRWLEFKNVLKIHPLPSLSVKEAEVHQLICNGYSGTQIRELESIGKTRYGTLVKSIKQKLNCENVTELIQISIINKWVTITPSSYVRKHSFISSS